MVLALLSRPLSRRIKRDQCSCCSYVATVSTLQGRTRSYFTEPGQQA